MIHRMVLEASKLVDELAEEARSQSFHEAARISIDFYHTDCCNDRRGHDLRVLRAKCRLVAIVEELARNGGGLVPISKRAWLKLRASEPSESYHECDDPSHTECMCKGACSCHWVQQ